MLLSMMTNCILILLLEMPGFQTFLRMNPTWIGSTDRTDARDGSNGKMLDSENRFLTTLERFEKKIRVS